MEARLQEPGGEEDVLDLRQVAGVLLRHLWIVLLATAAGLIGSLVATLLQTPQYEARTLLLVQEGQQSPLPTVGELEVSRRLATTYQRLITTTPVLEEVVRDLNLPYGPQTLQGKVRAEVVRDTQLLEIRVRDPDPVQAARVADRLAQVFIARTQQDRLLEIARLQAAAEAQGIASEPLVQAQVAALGSLRVVEPAQVPTAPVSPRPLLNAVLGLLLGLMLGVGGAFLLEFLDPTVRSRDEVERLAGLPTLGVVPRWRQEDGFLPFPLQGDRGVPEPYRFLETSLEFLALAEGRRAVLLVTSPARDEGKTTTAAALALAAAQAGKRVVLADLDLHKPSLPRVFQVGGKEGQGLTSVLLQRAALEEALLPIPTPQGSLHLLPAGPIPPDPGAVIRSPAFHRVLERLRERADLVLLDSPPVLAVTDPVLLAPLADGVLLVVAERSTPRGAVRDAVRTLEQARGRLLGVVYNMAQAGDGRYGYYYSRYYSYGYGRDGGRSRRGAGWWRHALRLLGRRGRR